MVENRAVSEGERELSLLNLPDLPRTVLFTMMQEQLTKVPIDLGVRCTEQSCRQGPEDNRASRKSSSAPDGRHVHRQKSEKKVKRVSWTENNEVFYVSTSTPTWTARCSSARLPSPVLKLTAPSLRHDCEEKASNTLPPNPPPVLCSRLHVRRTSSGTGHRIVLAPPPEESVCSMGQYRETQRPLLPASFVKTRAAVLEPDKYHLPPLAASRSLTTGKVKPQG